MATQYFRVTAYHPTLNISVIMDCNGMYEKLWQFSSYMIQKGFKVIEVSTDEKFIAGSNLEKTEYDRDHIVLRAHMKGEPKSVTLEHGGITYRAVTVADKTYIPDKDKRA